MKVSGKVFFHYQYNVQAYEEGDADTAPDPRFPSTDYNGFYLTRSYITLKAKMHPAISANITADITKLGVDVVEDEDEGEGESKSASISGGGYMLYIKYAYVTFKIFPFFQITAGAHPTPIVGAACRAWEYRYVQKDFVNLWSGIPSADLGVAVHGSFPSNFGEYQISVVNGEGVQSLSDNEYKAVELRVTVTPIQMVDAMKGFEISLFARYDKDDKIAGGRNQTDMLYGGWLNYRYEINDNMGINVGGGAFMGTYTDETIADEDYQDTNYMAYSGWLRFRFYKGAALFVRYDMSDPNTENDEDKGIGYLDETSLLIAGVSYQIHKSVDIALDYQQKAYTAEDADENTIDPDTLVYVHMQWSF
ncbi:MAG: hypothetical protein P9M14_17590 [Candidatus Alcyoniella australis]|nr:hypothetical protein [Candidatus Alcyoniella australis]